MTAALHVRYAFELVRIAFFFLCGFAIEAIAIADEKNTFKNIGFNVRHAAFRSLFDLTAGAAFAAGIYSVVAQLPTWRSRVELSQIRSIWMALLFTLLVMFVRDFFYYWFHRLQHASKWLWAEHALHHSDEHMNVTTALRHHWLETPLETLLVALPLSLIFKGAVPTLAGYFLAQGAGFFIHLNSRIYLGPWLGSPAYHRIHHSRLKQHIDRNFAAFFPLWDILFGTYHKPDDQEPAVTGLDSGEAIYSLAYAIVMPFDWWRKIIRRNKSSVI